MNPNHTFIFDYISYYHMNSIMLSKIFLNFLRTSKLKLSRTLKKYSKNTSTLYKIFLNAPRNTLKVKCVIWIHYPKFGRNFCYHYMVKKGSVCNVQTVLDAYSKLKAGLQYKPATCCDKSTCCVCQKNAFTRIINYAYTRTVYVSECI